jgi:protein tyrosine phosphatase (PTP) superfamily phosphohydrolase (DUF442 family)
MSVIALLMPTNIEDISNFFQLSDRIATAGQPTIEQYPAIAAAGYQVVINLALTDSPSALADECTIAHNLGLEYIHIPVIWTEPTLADFQAFMNILDKYSAQKVFVHCAANKRVSAFLYLYRQLAEGIDEPTAYQDLVKIWIPNPIWQDFIDSTNFEYSRLR